MNLQSLPNTLTIGRIIAVPLFVALFYWGGPWGDPLAALVFILAAVTDWIDGYLARKLGVTTPLGEFLDPVADKLMVAAALVMLVQLERTDAIVAIIIVGREITISALREWMAHIGAAKSVAVSFIGKLKTTAQMVAIPMLLYYDPLFGLSIAGMGEALIWLAAALTLWSMGYYLGKAWPVIRDRVL